MSAAARSSSAIGDFGPPAADHSGPDQPEGPARKRKHRTSKPPTPTNGPQAHAKGPSPTKPKAKPRPTAGRPKCPKPGLKMGPKASHKAQGKVAKGPALRPMDFYCRKHHAALQAELPGVSANGVWTRLRLQWLSLSERERQPYHRMSNTAVRKQQQSPGAPRLSGAGASKASKVRAKRKAPAAEGSDPPPAAEAEDQDDVPPPYRMPDDDAVDGNPGEDAGPGGEAAEAGAESSTADP
eukprot:TRINITY_DN8982_c0_g1_i1.p2 TRINITY_DN8982_c0_g1~~TRINITY_DN8982_c0_g1_i1.p2  ORF type:complete len:239 (+),score=34.46 TRINITY_DN8982_c0_g1_i1:59-775(+)